MRSYGMFDMDFRNSLNKELDVRNVRSQVFSLLCVKITINTNDLVHKVKLILNHIFEIFLRI